jgi:purine-binding chemotaxis protein CheW
MSGRELTFATEESYLRRSDDRRSQRRGVLTFVVGDEVYGLDIISIREIIKSREIAEVPRAPRFLLGVVTVRGLVLPVIDLRLRLRLEAAPLGRAARILIVMHRGERYGLLVDEVHGVVRFADGEIEPPPPSLALAEGPFLAGIGRWRDGDDATERLVVLLALDALLSFSVVRT